MPMRLPLKEDLGSAFPEKPLDPHRLLGGHDRVLPAGAQEHGIPGHDGYPISSLTYPIRCYGIPLLFHRRESFRWAASSLPVAGAGLDVFADEANVPEALLAWRTLS